MAAPSPALADVAVPGGSEDILETDPPGAGVQLVATRTSAA
jgi:hypothetical protein